MRNSLSLPMPMLAAAWLVSRLSRSDPTVALILAGMMISSLFSAGTSFIKLVADTQQQLPAITYWLMGSLSTANLQDVLFLLPPFGTWNNHLNSG